MHVAMEILFLALIITATVVKEVSASSQCR